MQCITTIDQNDLVESRTVDIIIIIKGNIQGIRKRLNLFEFFSVILPCKHAAISKLGRLVVASSKSNSIASVVVDKTKI